MKANFEFPQVYGQETSRVLKETGEEVSFLETEDEYLLVHCEGPASDCRPPVILLAEKQFFPEEVILEAFEAALKVFDKALEEGRAKI